MAPKFFQFIYSVKFCGLGSPLKHTFQEGKCLDPISRLAHTRQISITMKFDMQRWIFVYPKLITLAATLVMLECVWYILTHYLIDGLLFKLTSISWGGKKRQLFFNWQDFHVPDVFLSYNLREKFRSRSSVTSLT